MTLKTDGGNKKEEKKTTIKKNLKTKSNVERITSLAKKLDTTIKMTVKWINIFHGLYFLLEYASLKSFASVEFCNQKTIFL